MAPEELSSGWSGTPGSPRRLPPTEYWEHLRSSFPRKLVDRLAESSGRRVSELDAGIFSPADAAEGERLLAVFAADGWARQVRRYVCRECGARLDRDQYERGVCEQCDDGRPDCELIYERNLAPSRTVDWAVVIHGMNTSGAWQEEFSWFFATSQGRSVPVWVYKYGWITTGVILGRRRRKLMDELRERLLMLSRQAPGSQLRPEPDVIAHSFGTWLLGHLLAEEAERPEPELRIGRLILTGCVLRPDFPWRRVLDRNVVQQVMNHYGTRDPVVPWAHYTIWDSGPSGRRGFDRDPASGRFEVLNVAAEGYGHSDLFAVDKCVVDGRPLQRCPAEGPRVRHLDHTYQRYWLPFLTLPQEELAGLPDRADPPGAWRPAWWVFRGTLFPWLAIPFLLALLAGLAGVAGARLAGAAPGLLTAAGVFLAGAVVLVLPGIVRLVRRR